MSYERDKEIFTKNKKANIINKLDSYLSRTNCTSEEMDTIMDAADTMEIEKLEELEKYLDSAKKGALYDGSYIIEQIYDLKGIQNIESNTESVEETIAVEETVMDKLADYLIKSKCTLEESNEIYKLNDEIMYNDVADLDKVEQFIDNANKNEIYNVKFLKNIMNEVIEQNSKKIDEIESEEEIIDELLEDEEIEEEVKRDKKGIKTWFKEKFSKKDKKIDAEESESLESTNTPIEVKKVNNISLEVYVDEDKNNFIMNKSAEELGFITKEDLEKAEDGLFLLSEDEIEDLKNKSEIKIEYIDVKIKNEDKEEMKSNKEEKITEDEITEEEIIDESLEDEEIKEEVKRDKKGIKVWFKEKFSKKENKEKKENKIITFFKTKFSKKDIELEDEEIEEVKERQKIKLFSKKDKNTKKVETKQEETKFEDLSIQDKLFKYLHGTGCTWKSLIDIVNKVAIISEDEEKVAKLNEFLNKNKDLENDKKVAALIYENINILGKVEGKEPSIKINPMCEQIKDFFAKNKLDENEKVINLYNEIIMNDNNIDKLYDYIINNMEEAKNAENIINEMNKILGQDVKKIQIEPTIVKAKRVPKTVVSALEPTVELPKTNTTNVEKNVAEPKVVKTESETTDVVKNNDIIKDYNAYNELQNKLNNKLEDLKYLKHEYNVIEKSIYGKSLAEMTKEEIEEKDLEKQKELYQRKRDIMLIADSQKLMQLKEKLSEIKEVQQQIGVLSTKVGTYITKYGLNFEEQYNQKVKNDLNLELLSQEKKERMKSDFDEFNYYSDAELAAISKYIAREKENEQKAKVLK